jgi:hypothetical protein
MNRFVKRFMEYAEGVLKKDGSERPLIALHKGL